MKPFRVTNEQVLAEIKCYQGEGCIGCPFYGLDDCDSARGNDFNMYHDLLDSRELIDKQEALIKEMRKYFEDLSYNSNYPTQTLTMVELEKLTNINHQTALLFLEKTKDYA